MEKDISVREVDSLGRIVIPVEVRRALKISPRSLLKVRIENGHIALYKHTPTCIFCESQEGLKEVAGKHICKNCILKIKNL